MYDPDEAKKTIEGNNTSLILLINLELSEHELDEQKLFIVLSSLLTWARTPHVWDSCLADEFVEWGWRIVHRRGLS